MLTIHTTQDIGSENGRARTKQPGCPFQNSALCSIQKSDFLKYTTK